ncbi:Imm53 family immunity protein [Pectobacterium sp. B1J-3]|uniref:Imm53 family immunity protein n=1 Tax=Pectobacterium sp. B1J-3 TaxID=3385371 RepID=UPI003906CDB7
MNDELLTYLQNWYLSKCDGSWEHAYGFDISTIDNPGWKVSLTGEKNRRNIAINHDNGKNDWVIITANENEFKGYGGPEKLIFIGDKLKEWLG